MPQHNGPKTKRKAKKQVKASGRKPVVITKKSIRKYGTGITQDKVAFGKKKKPSDKGHVTGKIKYVGGREQRKKARRKNFKEKFSGGMI